MIKEKRQLFVSVGNNDDTAKMKINNHRWFIYKQVTYSFLLVWNRKTWIVNLDKNLTHKMNRERNLALYNVSKNKLICCRKLGFCFNKRVNLLFYGMLL